MEEHGERLVAVRYRADRVTGQRLKTVELVVRRGRSKGRRREKPDDLLLVRIGYDERELQRAVRAVGGIWNRTHQAWELRRARVVALGLERRVVGALDEVELLPERPR